MMWEWLRMGAADIKITCDEIGGCAGKANTPTLDVALTNIVQAIVGVIGGLALIFVIVSGLQMALASGSPKRYQQARESLIYSMVGVALAIVAYGIVFFVANAL
ncbi:MAG TPA: hypothetical protein VMT30_00590 [Candidatus Saccharimonadia bacterium]|nr:hypothetical protein [Candidatus Saccharimonadia bacterium]